MAEATTFEWSVIMTTESEAKLRQMLTDDSLIVATDPVVEGSPIISEKAMYNINIYVNFMLRGSIAVFGVINNIINMIIFYRLGLKDSMSVGLMALSFTDFVVNFLGIAGTMCFIWDAFYPNSVVDPVSFEFVAFGWFRDFVYLCSGWITTLLSIERCVCVVFPFKVKQIFTRIRCLVIVIIIYIVHIAVHMPVFLSQWLGWTKVEEKTANGTVYIDRMIVLFSENRAEIQMYIDIANGAVLPFPSQALVLISVIWMIFGLRVSARVRRYEKDEGDGKKSKLSYRESRLVKVILFLAIILTVCSVPRFLAVYAKQIFPEVSLHSQYGNLYVFMWNLAVLASTINSSVNIFVYMIVNSSYRAKFKELFKCNWDGKDSAHS